jgi:hypothetical protein
MKVTVPESCQNLSHGVMNLKMESHCVMKVRVTACQWRCHPMIMRHSLRISPTPGGPQLRCRPAGRILGLSLYNRQTTSPAGRGFDGEMLIEAATVTRMSS